MIRNPIFLSLAILIFTAIGNAQTHFATIRGVVVDPSGAAVPAAKLDIVNLNTGLSRETVTTGGGEYEIPYLPPGTYRLTATGPGFKKFVADNVLLSVGRLAASTLRLNLVRWEAP